MFISLKGKEQKNNLIILHAGVKKQQILVKFTYFQKSISDFLKSAEDLWYPNVILLQENVLNFRLSIWKMSCKKDGPILRILETSLKKSII